MTEVVSILSGSGVLGALALVAWLVIKLVEKSEQLTDARTAQSTTEEHLAEAQYKLDQTQLALTSALKLNDAQAKELADAIGTQPNTDLPPGDVHDRLVRWIAANTTASTDDASAAGTAVPANSTTAAATPRAG